MAKNLKVGDPVPHIAASNQDGKTIRLSDLRGGPVLVFFYPKDNTPGCTKEACTLRDDYSKYQKLGVTIFGVSRQSAESHRKFVDKFNLPFDLLIDEDGALAAALGVERMPLLGIHKRQSVLIGPDGRLIKRYLDVTPEKHSEEVLEDLLKLEHAGR